MSILWMLIIDPLAVLRAILDDGRWLWGEQVEKEKAHEPHRL